MDSSTFKAMIVPCYGQMLNMALRLFAGDRQAASDAVQDTVEYLWRCRHNINIKESAPAMCVTAVRNRCITMLRTKNFDNVGLEQCGLPDGTPADTDVTVNRIWQIINALPQPRRDVMILSMRGFDANEISQITKLTAVNVRQILSRTRRELRHILNEQS